jgi:hypothetical protein
VHSHLEIERDARWAQQSAFVFSSCSLDVASRSLESETPTMQDRCVVKRVDMSQQPDIPSPASASLEKGSSA